MPQTRAKPPTSVKPQRKRGRPTREEAIKRDEHLLKVATKIFLEQGYSATTMEMIASAAGTWKPGLYLKYETKQALFAAVFQSLTPRLILFPIDPKTDKRPVEDSLRDNIRTYIHFQLNPRTLSVTRMMLQEGHAFSEIKGVIEAQGDGLIYAPLRDYVREQIRRKVFRKMDVDFAVHSLINLIQAQLQSHMFFKNYDPPSPKMIEDWTQKISDLFLNGARS